MEKIKNGVNSVLRNCAYTKRKVDSISDAIIVFLKSSIQLLLAIKTLSIKTLLVWPHCKLQGCQSARQKVKKSKVNQEYIRVYIPLK
jgi:hypothetical protein